MKKILLVFALFIYGLAISQQSGNRFDSSEGAENDANYNSTQNRGPGGPPGDDDPDPVPIDDYIPVLLVGAFGIIIYRAYKKNHLAITK